MRNKKEIKFIISIVCSLCMTVCTPATEVKSEAATVSESQPFIEEQNLLIDNTAENPAVGIDGERLQQLKGLSSGTIFAEFIPEGNGYQSILGVSDNTTGIPNTYFHLYFNSGRLGFELRDQENGDYQKSYANVNITNGTLYKVAFVADQSYGYKIYMNGEKVLDVPIESLTTTRGYGFLADIDALNTAYLGKTDRYDNEGKPQANQYPFEGMIQKIQVYSSALTDAVLQEMTEYTATLEDYDNALLVDVSNLSDNVLPYGLQSEVEAIKSIHEGTILTRFTTDSTEIQSLFSISDGTAGNPNSYFHVYVSGGKVGFEIRRQTGGDYEKSSVTADINPGEENYLAFVASETNGYKIFLNGSLVLEIPVNAISSSLGYGFIDDISNLTDAYVGKTKRVTGDGSNANEYMFSGVVDTMKVYNAVIPDELLLSETGTIDMTNRLPVRKMNLFNVEAWNSPAFRIPSLLTTNSGKIIAVADIRYGNSNDSPNNIDTGILISSDGGATWSDPRLILNFLDYPNEPTSQITNSASYIDCCMVQGENGRIFLFVDVIRGGTGQANAIASSGYTEVAGERRLLLEDDNGNSYTLGADNKVYNSENEATSYTVGDNFTLYENGSEISNIFYKTSPIKVLSTTYVAMCYSDDDGNTWSVPKLMDFQTDDMKFFGVAPGVGITIKNGSYAGRMVVPMYYTSSNNTTEYACVVYSDDGGNTWTRGESPNDGRIGGAKKLHESQIVEMPNGQLKMYARSLGKASVATSFDGGTTWDDTVESDDSLIMSTSSGCQLSIINYSQQIDGKPAVIFSNPAATTRSNGTVRVGLIEENGTYDNGETKYTINWISSKVIRPGEFAYSCLTELPNGNIGILYEENNTRYTLDHLVYAEYTLDYLLGR